MLIRDLAYTGPDGHARQKLDLYLPLSQDHARRYPLIVWIHGGGWALGDKSDCPAKRMVERGYAVASVNYRLSGDAVFPAQIEDCKAALRWLRANADTFHLDPDRIGVWGSSAGGHLAALLGTSGGIGEFDVGAHLDQSSRVQAVCDFYGPSDVLKMDAHALAGSRLKHDAPDSPESRLLGGPIQRNKDKAARANPIVYIDRDDPPFFIVHGDRDMVVPPHQSELLYKALKKVRRPVHLHIIEGAGHGDGIGGRELDEKVNDFFDRTLRGVGPPMESKAVVTRGRAARPRNERGAGAPPQQGGWPRVIQDDDDRDGVVTRSEFKGPPPLFERMDRNRDGRLTQEDFPGP